MSLLICERERGREEGGREGERGMGGGGGTWAAGVPPELVLLLCEAGDEGMESGGAAATPVPAEPDLPESSPQVVGHAASCFQWSGRALPRTSVLCTPPPSVKV